MFFFLGILFDLSSVGWHIYFYIFTISFPPNWLRVHLFIKVFKDRFLFLKFLIPSSFDSVCFDWFPFYRRSYSHFFYGSFVSFQVFSLVILFFNDFLSFVFFFLFFCSVTDYFFIFPSFFFLFFFFFLLSVNFLSSRFLCSYTFTCFFFLFLSSAFHSHLRLPLSFTFLISASCFLCTFITLLLKRKKRKLLRDRETESLLTAAQNNAIRTNYIKARINKMQQNSKCRLCGDKDKTINHIISKSAQKVYKTRHDWVSKVIHGELCKKLKFDHTNKWYMHNPASVLENDTHKLLWDFGIQTDYLISARRPGLIIIIDKKEKKKRKKKRTCRIADFAAPVDHRVKLKKMKRKISTWTLLGKWRNYGTWK